MSHNAHEDDNAAERTSLILLFSHRAKVRKILTAGLLQGGYRIIQAESLYTAGVKANQYVPDLVILDIARDNVGDFLLLERLRRSVRTRDIPVLVSATAAVHKRLTALHHPMDEPGEGEETEGESSAGTVRILEYPFHFADLLARINAMFALRRENVQSVSDTTETGTRTLGEKLFDLQVPVQTKLLKIESVLQQKWAFPFTVVRALDIMASDDSGCRELSKCIEADPGAASSVIRVANAVYYAKRSGRVGDVGEAVLRIGFNETRSLLACFALIDTSPGVHKQYGFERQAFWMHSLASAVIAQKLCQDCRHRRPEIAFVSALIHDFGKIPLDNSFAEVFPRLLAETTGRIMPFRDAEFSLMGFSHADLGHFLTNQWNFPSSISLAILNHHKPRSILRTKSPMDRVLQEAVYVANIFAKAMNLGHSCDEVVDGVPGKMLTDLKIPHGPKRYFFDSVLKDLKKFCDYLNLPQHDIVIGAPHGKDGAEVTIVYGPESQFHPIALALGNNGYRIRVARQPTEESLERGKVAVFIPDRGSPLDITFREEDEEPGSGPPCLRIFLLDGVDVDRTDEAVDRDGILLVDRSRLDMRYVLQAIDRYLERVVVAERREVGREEDAA